MIEIERKFRLSPDKKKAIEEEVQAKYGPIKPVRQTDEVFLQGMDSFATFKQGMPITRLRTAAGVTTLAYKRRLNDGGDMLEHELVVSSSDTMRAILSEMDYRPVTKVDKIRIEVKVSAMAIALDTVDGLGDFLEIEVMAKDESGLEATEHQIMVAAAEFGLTEADLEPRKYDHMVAALKSRRDSGLFPK
ncbi:MAG TPA: class IV adenylate cyclase [Candidatus Saccharimonadales bacterium]|nr:class IV adenylate cyclase [Candidatus Saccharimonadales bacterium]